MDDNNISLDKLDLDNDQLRDLFTKISHNFDVIEEVLQSLVNNEESTEGGDEE